MKDPSHGEAATVFEWYSNFKTEQWDERICTPSLISGSSIVARYFSSQSKKTDVNLKQRKLEKYEYVRTLKRSYGLTKDEESACASESMAEFLHFLYQPVNADLSIEKFEQDAELYSTFHYQEFIKGLKNWNNQNKKYLKNK